MTKQEIEHQQMAIMMQQQQQATALAFQEQQNQLANQNFDPQHTEMAQMYEIQPSTFFDQASNQFMQQQQYQIAAVNQDLPNSESSPNPVVSQSHQVQSSTQFQNHIATSAGNQLQQTCQHCLFSRAIVDAHQRKHHGLFE